jgi:hypothetical protein
LVQKSPPRENYKSSEPRKKEEDPRGQKPVHTSASRKANTTFGTSERGLTSFLPKKRDSTPPFAAEKLNKIDLLSKKNA